MTSPRLAPPPDPTPAPRPAHVARVIAGAIVVATIVGCGLSLTIALLAVRLAAMGYSAHAIGVNTAAGGVATLAGAPLIPWLAHRLGVARLLLVALLIGGAALVGFTLTSDYGAWLGLRFAIGFAVTVMFVLSEFWITTWAPDGHNGLAIALYVTSLSIGFAVGPLILTIVGTAGNAPFHLGAVLFVGAAVPLMLNAATAPRLETRSAKSVLSFLREAPAATLAGLLHGAIEVAGLSLLPIYAIRSGVGVAQGALLASLFILGNTALQLPLGLVADRMDRRRLLLILGVLGLLGALVLGTLGLRSVLLFEAILLVWGGIVGGLYPVGLGQLATQYSGADLATANSAYVMSYAIGMLAGPPLIGSGLDIAPPAGFFWAIAGLTLLYLVVAVGAAFAKGPPTSRPALERLP